MDPLRIENFGGLVLTKDEKKGPFWTALKAANCDVQSGSIDVAYNIDTATAVAGAGAGAQKKVFNISGATFLEWTTAIQIAISPLADNSTKRIYFTGAGVPQVTDFALATTGAAPYPKRSYVLGLPVPPKLVSGVSTGGVAPVEDRGYTYTLVSPWGEESAPALPVLITSNATGASVDLEGVGAVTRVYASNGALPIGVTVNVTFVATAPSLILLTIPTAAYWKDFWVGDRIWLQAVGLATDPRQGSYTVMDVDVTTGRVWVQANIWSNAAPGIWWLWRTPPVNSFNVITATANTPAAGQVTVFLNTTNGLRVGENLKISSVLGLTDINATFPIVSVGTDIENPSVVIAKVTAQVYTGSGRAKRVEEHNTGEIGINNITFAAGIATVTVDSTAHIVAGAKVLIFSVNGAYQANGVRTVLAVTPTTFTIALAAMAGYANSGIVVFADTYPYTEVSISLVTSALVVGTTYRYTFTPTKAHDFVVGEFILGYDIGGAVEANNLMCVETTTATQITCLGGQPLTAYTAGGKLVRCQPQFRKRIYRTNQGNTGAEFQLVADIPGDRAHYFDVIESAALGAILESDTWIQPPTDMTSIVAHPHGFLAGASKNTLCPSVPFQPHAYPLGNQVALPSDIVAAGIFGTTIVAFTQEIPYLVGGYTPDQLTRRRMDVGERCTSARSVVSTGLGVFYRGTSGMFLIGSDSSDNVTKNFLPASSFVNAAQTPAAFWGNKIVWIDEGTQSGYVFDPVREDKGLTTFDVDFPVYDLHVSPIDGQLYASYLEAGVPKRAPLFKIVANPSKFTYWTQYIRFPVPLCVGALQIDWRWDQQSATLKDRENVVERNMRHRRRGAINQNAIDTIPIGGSAIEQVYSPDITPTVPSERFLKVKLIANPDRDDAVTLFDDFVVSTKPVRVANGVKADVFQVQLTGNAKVSAVTLAESIHELRGV